MGGGKGELSLLLSLRGHACALIDPLTLTLALTLTLTLYLALTLALTLALALTLTRE